MTMSMIIQMKLMKIIDAHIASKLNLMFMIEEKKLIPLRRFYITLNECIDIAHCFDPSVCHFKICELNQILYLLGIITITLYRLSKALLSDYE